ncbi:MAG TPA: DapH/DapD/GlmU-related protein [Spirochaetota bacterium]
MSKVSAYLSRHSFLTIIGTVFSVFRTRLFYRRASLIRFPIDLRGKSHIVFGRGLTTGRYCRIEAYPQNKSSDACVIIGENVQINDFVHVTGVMRVSIGNHVLIASRVFISDSNHGRYGGNGEQSHPDSPPASRPIVADPVTVEDNVWLGENVSVLAGVTIGKGSIIGTSSVVTKSIPPFSIAVGAPARVVKTFDFKRNKWVPRKK